MALAQLISSSHQLVIHSHFCVYGDAATQSLAEQVRDAVSQHWNKPQARIGYKENWYNVIFEITANYEPQLTPETVWYNTDPKLFFFRIEEYSPLDISFADGIGSNTGFFKLANLLQTSTTAAHEYGHMIGLHHPKELDVRGKPVPGMMYPRGTLCDPHFQYDPDAAPGAKGGTLDPKHRAVLPQEIEALKLHRLRFDAKGFAILGDFTSIYHSHYLPSG